MSAVPPVTRRRALALGAAAGLTTLLSRTPAPSFAARRAEPRSFGLDVAFGDGRRTGVLRPGRRFDLVGVRGDGLAGGLEIRVRRRGGAWSGWVPLGSGHDHRPDTGTGQHASDPVWAGGADELQLRCERAPRGPLRLLLVSVPRGAKRRGAKAVAAAKKAKASQGAAPRIVSRSEWGGDSIKPREAPAYGDVQVAFVHHTVSANDYGPEDSPGIVLAMAKYHRDGNGWNDLGYNFVVDKYGQVFEGRAGGIDQAVVGAQAQGYNAHSTGIANIGTFTDVGQTPAALDAMARLIAWKLPLHGVPVEGEVVVVSAGGDLNKYKSGTRVTFQRISGHRDGDATACPGNALYAQLPELRRRAAAVAPAVASTAIQLETAGPGIEAVAYGEAVALSGAVRRADGTPVAGQAVQVQKRGKRAWVTVARATTDDAGAWGASVAWRAAGRLRVRTKVAGSPVAYSPTYAVGLVPVLEAAAQTKRVRAGQRVTVQGTVKPVGTVYVDVEREVRPGTFQKLGRVTVRARRSRFSARIRLTRPGLYRLTPRTGTKAAPATASSLYVRAVRPGASLQPAGPDGGAASPSPPTGGAAPG